MEYEKKSPQSVCNPSTGVNPLQDPGFPSSLQLEWQVSLPSSADHFGLLAVLLQSRLVRVEQCFALLVRGQSIPAMHWQTSSSSWRLSICCRQVSKSGRLSMTIDHKCVDFSDKGSCAPRSASTVTRAFSGTCEIVNCVTCKWNVWIGTGNKQWDQRLMVNVYVELSI